MLAGRKQVYKLGKDTEYCSISKNSRWHSGINREPYLAMFGRRPCFGLKDLDIPQEVINNIETEEELYKVLGEPIADSITEEPTDCSP